MKSLKFAFIQSGYCVFGVGYTVGPRPGTGVNRMLVNFYRVTAISDTLRGALLARNEVTHWDVPASNLGSAWRKFCRQRFGALLPDPADYDIRFLDARSYGALS